jgi:hypothetical protein
MMRASPSFSERLSGPVYIPGGTRDSLGTKTSRGMKYRGHPYRIPVVD